MSKANVANYFDVMYTIVHGKASHKELRFKLMHLCADKNLHEMGFVSNAQPWLLKETNNTPGVCTYTTSDLYKAAHGEEVYKTAYEELERLTSSAKCRTGGVLNSVNWKHNTHLARVTISVNKLIAFHKPTTAKELEELICKHVGDAGKSCACGCPAFGLGFMTWGENLYHAVRRELKDPSSDMDKKLLDEVTEEQCVVFMHDLYTVGSIQGTLWEQRAHEDIAAAFPDARVRPATEREDMDFAFDLLIENKGKQCGVQVKPHSYQRRAERYPDMHESNQKKNDRWGKKVVYLYYDASSNTWSNFREVTDELSKELDLLPPVRRKRRFFELGSVSVDV
jgi:hypothetical protein